MVNYYIEIYTCGFIKFHGEIAFNYVKHTLMIYKKQRNAVENKHLK